MIAHPLGMLGRGMVAVGGVSLSQFGDNEVGADEDTCYFSSAPTSGQLIVLLHGRGSNGSVALGAPAGFTVAHAPAGAASNVAVYTKVAGGSEPSSYLTTAGAGNIQLCGYVFNGASGVNIVEAFEAVSATSILVPAATQAVAAGSFVVAFRVGSGNAGSVTGWNNSFASRFEWTGTRQYRGAVADRTYAGAEAAEQVNASWSSGVINNRAVWVEVYP